MKYFSIIAMVLYLVLSFTAYFSRNNGFINRDKDLIKIARNCEIAFVLVMIVHVLSVVFM